MEVEGRDWKRSADAAGLQPPEQQLSRPRVDGPQLPPPPRLEPMVPVAPASHAAALTWGPPEMESDAADAMDGIAMEVAPRAAWGESVELAANRATAHTHGGLMVPRSLLLSRGRPPAAPGRAVGDPLLNCFL